MAMACDKFNTIFEVNDKGTSPSTHWRGKVVVWGLHSYLVEGIISSRKEPSYRTFWCGLQTYFLPHTSNSVLLNSIMRCT